MSEEDWSFCEASLLRHSRTFAIPIAALPFELKRTITCAYLLCRIADTVEDTAAWSVAEKERLQRQLLDVLDDDASSAPFVASVAALAGGDPDERALLLDVERVMRCFSECPKELVRSCRAWISELIRGMCIYSRRSPGADGMVCLESEADLERYCYFVAGTIGRLLTECFVAHIGLRDRSRLLCLRENAERFATGLQMVNILRDIQTDLGRGQCFIPRTVLSRADLSPRDLVDGRRRRDALNALKPLFDLARQHLDAAFDYTLALPREEKELRSFCAIPLWLAVRTLDLCASDPEFLSSGHRVKLSKSEVLRWVVHCSQITSDDAALKESYRSLSSGVLPPAANA